MRTNKHAIVYVMREKCKIQNEIGQDLFINIKSFSTVDVIAHSK